jgi:hypothetical protein
MQAKLNHARQAAARRYRLQRIFLFDNRGDASARPSRSAYAEHGETGRRCTARSGTVRSPRCRLTGAPLPPPTVGSFSTADTPLGSGAL